MIHPKNNKLRGRDPLYKPFRNLLNGVEVAEKTTGSVSPETPKKTDTQETEESIFKKAMEGVSPLERNKGREARASNQKGKSSITGYRLPKNTGKELLLLFNESRAWDISFSDEYMEGAISGIAPKTMKKLKKGEISIQDHIDLHGLTKKEAESKVNTFIINSFKRGLRCVLVIHGRGLGSVDHQPAIKNQLPVWFKRGPLKKVVLAFVTARPCDGGPGAIYVLLRKR